jgi:hypothetical protein
VRKIWVIALALGIALLCQPVLASPGISVSIEVIDKITGGADLSAEYNVKVTSITTVDEDVVLTIRSAEASELFAGEQPADISWFDWTSQSFSLPYGDTVQFPLYVSLPAGVSAGDYRFVADGSAVVPGVPTWMIPPESSASQQIIVTTEETIPEFSTIAIPVATTLGLLLLIRRRKRD